MAKNPISVSVIMITYDHENYIKQAIESILNQETNFTFELIISNDNSPDNTEEIIQNIILENPKGSIINYTKHALNLGMNENYFWAVNKCEGDLIAVCEGDDYWLDPLKLQKQYDFLQKNDKYSMVFTPALRYYENKGDLESIRNRYFEYNPDDFKLENVLKLGGGFYPTCTSMYRKSIFNVSEAKKFMTLHSTGDYPIAILATIKGKIGYIDEITAVYRIQENSVSNKKFDTCLKCVENVDAKYKNNINFLKFIFEQLSIQRSLAKYLICKENYILLSKYIDCRFYSGLSKLFWKLELSPKFRFRITLKFIYTLSIGKKSSKLKFEKSSS